MGTGHPEILSAGERLFIGDRPPHLAVIGLHDGRYLMPGLPAGSWLDRFTVKYQEGPQDTVGYFLSRHPVGKTQRDWGQNVRR